MPPLTWPLLISAPRASGWLMPADVNCLGSLRLDNGSGSAENEKSLKKSDHIGILSTLNSNMNS